MLIQIEGLDNSKANEIKELKTINKKTTNSINKLSKQVEELIKLKESKKNQAKEIKELKDINSNLTSEADKLKNQVNELIKELV